MNRLRNPFTMRASEKIESPENFIRLYDSTILNVLIEKHEKGTLWNNVVYINSSPGGGKTSLLRVFEPASLMTLQGNRSIYKPFHKQLKKLDVLDDQSIKLLGVSLLCTRNYETLEDLDISSGQKTRFFFSLLNARIVIATLRSILKHQNLPFPEGLTDLSFDYNDEENYFLNGIPKNGKDLYEWASSVERGIYRKLDSFIPIEDDSEGHNELFSFSILKPESFLVNGKSVFEKILFMLDDTHKLAVSQREKLEKFVIEKRENYSLWISQRLEALTPKENLRSFEGRDYEVINLEHYWAQKSARFKNSLLNIANSRAAMSTDGVVSFSNFIEESLNEEEFKDVLINSASSSLVRILELTSFTTKFDDWIDYIDTLKKTQSPLELALTFKKVEILITRQVKKTQLSFDFPLDKTDLQELLKSTDCTPAARLFLSTDGNIPYYFGIEKLIDLSSHNIEQFLNFSSGLYEEMLSNKLLGTRPMLSPSRQERIVKKIVKNKWLELPKIIPHSNDVLKFLTSLGNFCHDQSYQENAPYTPGVNGVSVKLNKGQLSIISEEGDWYELEEYSRLADVVSTCIAYNLLEVRKTKQGTKNMEHAVYYLNRWLCVRFNLPFGYGGFRHKNPNDLIKWIK